MKDTPLLMTPDNAQKIFDGRKVQTRRVITPQPPAGCEYMINGAGSHALCRSMTDPTLWVPPTATSTDHRLVCPWGGPWDHAWIREAHTVANKGTEDQSVLYRGDPMFQGMTEFDWRWTPSIHMPKWACRTHLEILSVKVERIQDISNEDKIAEGMDRDTCMRGRHDQWIALWTSIHGIDNPNSWDANPFVWCIEFRKVEPWTTTTM